jgi:hypothetical protein
VSRCRYSAEKKVVGDNTDYTLKIKRARFTRPFGKQLVNGFGPNSSCSLFCLKHGSHFYPKEVHTPLDVRTCLFRWLVFLPQALLCSALRMDLCGYLLLASLLLHICFNYKFVVFYFSGNDGLRKSTDHC